MEFQTARYITVVVALTSIALASNNAAAQTTDPVQILDRVTVTGANFAVDLKGNDPDRMNDFSVLFEGSEIPAETNLVDCAVSVTDGLFCIDRKEVVNWSNIDDAASRSTVFDCANPALGLDSKKANTCTALARNAQKAIYLGGKQNGKSNLVGKILETATPTTDPAPSCPTGFTVFSDSNNPYWLCFSPLATGRPLVQDIDVIEGDLAVDFAGEEVLLVLEERKTLLQYSRLDPAGAPTVTEVIASGKNDWNLIGNEQLLNAALQAYGADDFYGLASTTKGRILAVDTDAPDGFEVFDFMDHRVLANGDPASLCVSSGDDSFDISVSDKTGLLYATDRDYCLVHVLQPVADGALFTLEIVEEGMPGMMTPLTLSTNDPGGLGIFPPLLVNITPGINVDLSVCGLECTAVTAPNGADGLTLREVNLGNSTESSITLFQVIGYPDCRWDPATCAGLFPDFTGGDPVTFLKGKDVIIDADPMGPIGPAFQLLNLEPLLPLEIKALYPDGLPPMLMEREIRASAQNGYLFDAFFGVAPDGLIFEDTYELEINVEALLLGSGTGNALGCFLGLPTDSPLYTDGADLGTLNWDVVSKVSEKYETITDDPATGNRRPYAIAPNFETRVINTDCTNPPRSRDGGWSMVSYGLEITPCTAMRDEAGTGWITEGSCDILDPPFNEADGDPAVLAKLLLKEYKDVRDALNQLACVANEDIDGMGALAPIDSNTCNNLDTIWVNGLDKLVKGLEATLQPKTSQGNENFGAFESKLQQLLLEVQNYMPPNPSMRPDLANRKGALEARLLTIEHIYEDRFVPSIQDAGFGDTGWVH